MNSILLSILSNKDQEFNLNQLYAPTPDHLSLNKSSVTVIQQLSFIVLSQIKAVFQMTIMDLI